MLQSESDLGHPGNLLYIFVVVLMGKKRVSPYSRVSRQSWNPGGELLKAGNVIIFFSKNSAEIAIFRHFWRKLQFALYFTANHHIWANPIKLTAYMVETYEKKIPIALH